MLWYKEVGFSTNPFSIKPAPFDYKIIGYDTQEILDKISKGAVLFIEGKYGYGKTTMIKSIINKFGGNRDIVYYSTNRPDNEINVEGLLHGKYGTFGKLFRIMPKEMIVILDEVDDLTPKDQEDIYRLFTQGNIKSVLFFGSSFDHVKFSVELKKLMVNNVIQLTKLTQEEAVELVHERISDLKLLSDEVVKKVFKLSDQNPRIMLENLEDICKYAVENNDDEVTEEHIKEVLKVKESKPNQKKPRKKRQEKVKKEKKEKASKKEIEQENYDEEPFFVEEIQPPKRIPPDNSMLDPELVEEPDVVDDIPESDEPEYFY